MTALIDSFKKWSVLPLNPSEVTYTHKFHSIDIRETEGYIPDVSKIQKDIYLVPNFRNLELHGLKLCEHAANYLLGLGKILKKTDYVSLGCAHIIAVDPKNKILIKGSNNSLYVAIDFTFKDSRRMTVAYSDEEYHADYLVLAEKIAMEQVE